MWYVVRGWYGKSSTEVGGPGQAHVELRRTRTLLARSRSPSPPTALPSHAAVYGGSAAVYGGSAA
eukprot:1427554-Rhodomonas_salina.1